MFWIRTRQTIDARTHVDRLDHQPHLRRCRDHGSCRNSFSQPGTHLPTGNSILQPPGLCSTTTPPAAGAPTLTGTSVSAAPPAASASFSLRRQR
ncbi:MAG: hypothetical protein MZW92_37755 [Comamonadaceae bacterium]|nr:hypothetical protein [Comamonadaceae bacterium]